MSDNLNFTYCACIRRRYLKGIGYKDVNKRYGLIPNISNYIRISNVLSLNGNLGGKIVFGNNKNTNVLVNTPPLKNKF